ncbi:hypothetical protein RDI58_022122 [Solanum bulbocastanum]
MGERART